MRTLAKSFGPSLAGILLLVGVVLFMPNCAVASCGDYLVLGKSGPLAPQHAFPNHPATPLPHKDCPNCSRLPNVPIAPVVPVVISVSENHPFGVTQQDFAPDPSLSARWDATLSVRPMSLPDDIFHPPRCAFV